MKVLWFTNIPVFSLNKNDNNITIGGWLHSLANILRKSDKIQLGIAFYYNRKIEPFNESGVAIYPLYTGLDKCIKRKTRSIIKSDESKDDIYNYLNIINTYSPDIIHIHGTEFPFGRLIDYINIPIVISIQGNLTVYCHFFYRGMTKYDIEKYTPIKQKLRFSTINSLYSFFLKRSIREQDFSKKIKHIIGRTNWDNRIRRILFPNARYYHNDEILRPEFYNYKWSPVNNEKFTIYTTTTNMIYKGLETIFETIDLLEQVVNFNFIWKIGGLNESSNIVQLCIRKYKKKSIFKRLVLLGNIDATTIINEMLCSDLYVMASHIENSPNNLCEAMILGLPIVTTHAGGTISLLENNKEGILIQDGDPWSMAGAILEMASNSDYAIKCGENARKRALERHNPRKITDELIKIYNSIISE